MINIPIIYNIPEYAKPLNFSISFADMGDASLSYDILIPAEINPDFSLDWNIVFNGETFKNTILKPQGIKDNKSL
ncbi:MAG: hypothetical protein RR513_09320, partial [Muribaculaceae bacterium]